MNSRQFLATSLISIALGLTPLGAALGQLQAGDPPGRVGRVAEMSGTVSFHTADANQWGPATLNYPVTGGNSFWTEPRSHAAIDVGASRIYLDSSTQFDVTNVDDQSFVASLGQGAVYLRISSAAGGDQYEIDTPRGAVHIVQPGSYEVIAGDADHPTTVMAFEGSAQVVGPDVNATVNPQQAIYISGQNPASVNQGQAQPDDFIRFVQSEEQPYQNAGPGPQYASPEMTGYQDLNRYGQWNQDPGYGQVWYPQVDAGWAPYRDGHWAYVAPWGWTWIDAAPWGFTPFHYGRWVQVGHRWAWWPGRVAARPVYAPALVTFFGGFGGLSVGISIGQSVGWIPLGPDEVYIPPYRHSPRYVRNVNITYVRNETTIVNVVNNTTVINNYNNYRNRDGATVVGTSTMIGSRPVAPDFHKIAPNGQLDSKRWADAKGMGGNPPLQPTAETRGANGYKPPVSPGPNVANGAGQQFNGGANKTKLTGTNGQPQGQPQGQNMNVQNNNGQPQPQGQVPAVTGGSNIKLPPLAGGQKPGNGTVNGQIPPTNFGAQKPVTGQFGQGQNGQVQNGQNNNGQNLKNLNNGQPQGQGPALTGGSNTKLPPLAGGQKPGNGNGSVNGQIAPVTTPPKNGNPTTVLAPQGQSQPNLKPNLQGSGSGQPTQKVEKKKSNGKGTIPLLNNDQQQTN